MWPKAVPQVLIDANKKEKVYCDAAFLKYTMYTPISGVCENKTDGQTGVHKNSPISVIQTGPFPKGNSGQSIHILLTTVQVDQRKN
ncbi:unnamed protein product [Porites lobata]|uniref:Uncharacterized protein n=1 Tax=Porites lobata TaxID=104759 RepID=A0ABN8PA26_9CNID|nr:unnamed protein product [Porites lobata]